MLKYFDNTNNIYDSLKFGYISAKYFGILPLTIKYNCKTKKQEYKFSKICEFFILCITLMHLISFYIYLQPRTRKKILEVDGHVGSSGNYYLLVTGTIFMVFSPVYGMQNIEIIRKICDDFMTLKAMYTSKEKETFCWNLKKYCIKFTLFVFGHCVPISIIICLADIKAYGNAEWLIISMIYNYPHVRILLSLNFACIISKMLQLKLKIVNERLEEFRSYYVDNPFEKMVKGADIRYLGSSHKRFDAIFLMCENAHTELELLNSFYGSYFTICFPTTMGILVFYNLFICITLLEHTTYSYGKSVIFTMTWWVIFSVIMLYWLVRVAEKCHFEVSFLKHC